MNIRKEGRKEGRKLIALFLGLMLLLLPFAFSFSTQAEDNSPEAVVNPDTPGSSLPSSWA